MVEGNPRLGDMAVPENATGSVLVLYIWQAPNGPVPT